MTAAPFHLLSKKLKESGCTDWTHANDNTSADAAAGTLPPPGVVLPGFDKKPYPPLVPGAPSGYYHGGGANK